MRSAPLIYMTQLDLMFLLLTGNRIAGVMLSVIAPSAVDLGFEPRSCQTRLQNCNRLLHRYAHNIKE